MKQPLPLDLRKVEKDLDLAGTYAGDGTLYTAVELAEVAAAELRRELERRGLLAPPQFVLKYNARFMRRAPKTPIARAFPESTARPVKKSARSRGPQ